MKLSRVIGQTSQILNLFVQDGSVSTGAGLANIPATTVSYTWFHNTQAEVSTGVAVSTASPGTYTSGAWTQVNSSRALGWYQFGLPDGALSIGDCVAIHFYVSTGAFPMVPLPVEIELTRDNNQQFNSSVVFLAHTSTSPANVVQAHGSAVVTSASGQFQVSTQAIDKGGYGVTTVASNITTNANVMQIYGSAAVTSASGQFRVSTQSLVGISTAANVIEVYGSPIVTSGAGILDIQTVFGTRFVTTAGGVLQVSTQAIDKGGYGVTTVASNITTNANVLQVYGSAIVTSAAGEFQVSTQTLAAGAGDIVSIYGEPIVTSGAGILNVSTQSLVGITVSTQTIDKTGYTLTAADKAAMMAVINTTVVGESYRASSDAGTMTQLMYEVLANITDFANSGTSRAVNSVTSHVAVGLEYQYDSTTPSSITRIM